MSDLSRFADPVWDRFFDFVFAEDARLSRAEVQEELRRYGIDVGPAFARIQRALKAQDARDQLTRARSARAAALERFSQVVAPKAAALRESLRSMIERLSGEQQPVYLRKLEKAASDEDLQSLLDDLYRLESFDQEKEDASQ